VVIPGGGPDDPEVPEAPEVPAADIFALDFFAICPSLDIFICNAE